MFQPFADRVLIKVIEDDEKESVIITLNKKDEDKPGPFKGTVIAHGPGTSGAKLECKKGDVVLFLRGTKFDDDAWPEFKGYMLVFFNQIIGTV